MAESNSTIAEFFSFLAQPKKFFSKQNNQKPYQRLFFVLKLVSFGLFFGVLINLITSYISSLVGFDQTANNIVTRDLKAFPPIIGLLLVAFIGPFLEELAFRLYFTTVRSYFFFGLNFFIYYIWEFIGAIFNLKQTFLYSAESIYLIIAIIFALTTTCSLTVPATCLKKNVTKYFNAFVYSTGIIFGLIHITNYENYQKYFYLIPILVLPQIFVSFVFAFVRTKLNIFWSLISHSMYNFALAIPLFSLDIFFGSERGQQITDILSNKKISELVSSVNPTERLILSGINLFILTMYLILIVVLVYTFFELFSYLQKASKTK